MKNILLYGGEELSVVNDNIKLIQRKTGLKYGTDALLLASFLPKCKKGTKAAELGSGTGIISLLALSRQKCENVTAFEIQEEYAKITERNAELNGVTDSLSAICCDIRNIPSEFFGTFDTVFSNPPYMAAEAGLNNDKEEKNIARREICGSIYDFAAAAKRLLRYGGGFYVVYRPDRMATLFDAMIKNGIEPKRLVPIAEYVGASPSLILVYGRFGGGHELSFDKTLYLRDKKCDTEYSDRTKRIYNGEESI